MRKNRVVCRGWVKKKTITKVVNKSVTQSFIRSENLKVREVIMYVLFLEIVKMKKYSNALN